jgi:hypothetical protein
MRPSKLEVGSGLASVACRKRLLVPVQLRWTSDYGFEVSVVIKESVHRDWDAAVLRVGGGG